MKSLLIAALVLFCGACSKKNASTKPIKCTLTYNSNNASSGTVPSEPITFVPGSTVVVMDNIGNLHNNGGRFCGWTTTATNSFVSSPPGVQPGFVSTPPGVQPGDIITMDSDIELHACWLDLRKPIFRFTYDGNGNTSGSPPVDLRYYTTYSQVFAKENTGGLKKNGANFVGWTYSPTDTAILEPNYKFFPIMSQTFYALYK